MRREESSGVSGEFGERVIKNDREISDDGRAIYRARCRALALLYTVYKKMLTKYTGMSQVERVRNRDENGMV